jgi:hypothetical protein
MFKRIVAEGWRISIEDYTAITEELEQLESNRTRWGFESSVSSWDAPPI